MTPSLKLLFHLYAKDSAVSIYDEVVVDEGCVGITLSHHLALKLNAALRLNETAHSDQSSVSLHAAVGNSIYFCRKLLTKISVLFSKEALSEVNFDKP